MCSPRLFLLLAACAVCLAANATNSTTPVVAQQEVEIDVGTFDDIDITEFEDHAADDHREYPDEHPDDYQPSDPIKEFVVGDRVAGSL
jgi:hypothetical protein